MTLRSLFFFDDWCLARRDNIARRLGQPEWVRDATYADPTENPFSYPTVLYDEHRKLWRMFYLGRETMPGAVYRKDEWLLTAESEDGIHWQRPDLTATVPLPSRMRPHEIFDRQRLATAGSVFLDESSPERRFKLPILAIDEDGQRASRLAWSADGYNWQIDHASRWHPGTPDPGFFTYHHAERNSHITLARPSHGDRRIALMETHDWRTWSEPEVIFHPDPLDPPMCEFYGIVVLPYRGIYVGILWMFETDPFDQWRQKLEGKIYGELVYSYDGLRFQRSLRQPFIGLNEPGEYGGGGIYPCAMVVDHEGQIRIYSGGTKGEHFQARTLSRDEPDYAAILLHRLRQDGFVYLESMAGAGYLTTRWVRLHDERLLLNVQAPYGEVRVQLSDIEGQPLPGYTFEQCQPFRGDSTAWQPQWQNQAGLAEHVGTPIRIDVRLYHARLYAIHGDIELIYASNLR